MKKIISLLLAGVMMLSLAACGTSGETETTGAPTETTAAPTETLVPETETPATGAPAVSNGSVEILSNIWAQYGENELFPVIGGNMENPVDGAPGNYDMAYAENLTYNLLVPAEQLGNIAEAATMIHMMNANTFTAGVVKLAEGADAAAFAEAMRDAIQSNQWMCGFPDLLFIASVGEEYVVVSFGVNDAMSPFQAHLADAYADAQVLYAEAIAG